MSDNDTAVATADPTLDALKGLLDGHFSRVDERVSQAMETVNAALKAFDDAPALKNSGFVSPDGETADKNIKTFADFLTAIKRKDDKRLRRVYGATKAMDDDGETKSLSGDTGATGGYTVPPQFINTILAAAAESAIMRPRAYVQPMASRTLTIPALDQTRAFSAGNTQYTGGIALNWTSEEASITETQPYFKEVNLEAWKLSGIAYVTSELNDDSAVGLESLLTRLFGTAVGYTEDYNFFQGDGVGKPLGIVNAPGTVTSGSSTVTAAGLETMMSRLFPDSLDRAIWVAHISLLPTIYALQAANNALVTFLPDLRGKPGRQLLGLPLFFTDKVPGSSATGKVCLIDPQYYVIGDRQNMQIAMSEHAAFTTDRIAWRVVHRVDGQPWIQAPVQITSSTSDAVSAFVAHGA